MSVAGESRPRRARAAKPHAGPVASITSAIWWARRQLGRYLSIRLKLTIYYGLMCLITLALAGSVMYWTVNHQLRSQVDDGLTAAGARLRHDVARMRVLRFDPRRPFDLPPNCHTRYNVYRAGMSAEELNFCVSAQSVLNSEAQSATEPGIVAGISFQMLLHFPSSPTLSGPFIGLCPWYGHTSRIPDTGFSVATYTDPCAGTFHYNALLMGHIRNGTTHFGTISHSIRTYEGPLSLPPALRRSHDILAPVYFVYENESAYSSAQHTILLTLLFGIPLGLIVALLAGFWIARAALRPIGRISRTVRAIGESKDLSRRIDFVGPNDEVGRLAETFDSMMERIEGVFETQRRFVADASHELRTPLTAIRGNADLMRIAPPDERDECLATIRKEAVRMTRLVNDLLLLAEAEAGQGQVHLVPLALDDVLLDVYGSARALADGRVELVLESADQVTVNGDADRLKQLLLNLVDNAVKFTPEGGTVSLSLTSSGDTARLAVSDSGIGIPQEEQDAIFRRFYRVEASRSRRGSGLGLSIVSWIVQEHGGRMELSSAPDKGTTFTVVLPALRALAGSARERDAILTGE